MTGECRRVNRWLQVYIDGRLEPRQLPVLEAHLDACAECRAALAAYEVVAQSAGLPDGAPDPAQLTASIMARITAYEAQKQERLAAQRQFALRWGDALLAALLATVSTLIFALLNPGVRGTMAQAFPLAAMVLSAPGPGAIAWGVWVVWIASGMGLTLVLAGAEVRATWRKQLAARLGQWPRPQWPTLRGV